jgi:hypothetical protein
MDKLSYNLFDLFVFSIPGSLIFTSILIHNTQVDICSLSASSYANFFSAINVYSAAFFILISYCIGFVCSLIANLLFKLVKLIWKPVTPNKTTLNNSEKFILIRELSKENFKFVERWNMLLNFSITLALSFIVSFVFLLPNLNCLFWYHFIILSAIPVLLVRRALKYNTWAIIELDNAVSILKLKQKGELMIPKKKEDTDES